MNSSYYLAAVITSGIILSMMIVPSLDSTSKRQLVFAQGSALDIAGKRPNVLVIMGDDFGFSDIGSFGGEISTPNLDALSRDGKILTNYHTMPTCSPARAAFLTGVDNHIAGIGTMYENIAPNQVGKPGYETYINNRVVTIAELLKDSGYHTLMSGKWHLSGEGFQNGTTPYDRGFEDVFTLLQSGANHFNADGYQAGGHPLFMRNDKIVPRPDNGTFSNDLYTNIMLEQIKKYQGDGTPLFMYLAFQTAHSPFQAPQEFIKKYEGVYDVGYDKLREQRLEKQKELGIWPANMTLPKRLPVLPAWDGLTPEQKTYRSKVLQVHAAMIDNMDYNLGRVIQYLKDIGEYDNTLILFTSDNGTSSPVEMKDVALTGITKEEANAFSAKYNNSAANVGNPNSNVNYGAWGAGIVSSPFSYFKASQGEGGVRSPFVIKLPNASNQTQTDIVRAFVHVNDMTPTLLEYANVTNPGSEYNGREISPMMGKSIKSLLDGKVERIHPSDEPIAQEMFNNTAVFMGDWKAMKNIPPISDGKWHLFNIIADPGENTDLASQHPEILAKLVSDYDKFAEDVGVVVPSSQAEVVQSVGISAE